MFGFNKSQKIFAAVDGTLMPITEVSDEVFAQKMMGDGYGIEPSSKQVYAPLVSTVVSIFPTKHAIGLKTKKGLEVVVHLGFDTVELQGEPFNVLVKVGDQVDETTCLAEMDLDLIKLRGKASTVVVACTNVEVLKSLPKIPEEKVQHGNLIGQLTYQ
ncbi:PTS sugar transporter subunit IIA [Xylocopilactobacillus apicola]|uniref:PTS glucose transporter subunit IIABC n=1 Tax=Xylocopilactobacillus apicola TaxID=2932184 RepID=A0AAU9D8D8_9LACO|nr:PTS glucose transporter subunit IIA [Xylocopilactobacillus apicola]BDR57730.1 PTS glucose transporter subunit IIABC [Xylocopilactobacillus apicola]